MTKINNVVSIQTYALIQNEGDLDRLDLYTLNMMHLELYLNCQNTWVKFGQRYAVSSTHMFACDAWMAVAFVSE